MKLNALKKDFGKSKENFQKWIEYKGVDSPKMNFNLINKLLDFLSNHFSEEQIYQIKNENDSLLSFFEPKEEPQQLLDQETIEKITKSISNKRFLENVKTLSSVKIFYFLFYYY